MSKHREVKNSHRYDDELGQIESDAKAADQATHGLTFALARHPERGFPIEDTPFCIWPVYIQNIEYVVYYWFDDDQVELVSIIKSQDDESGF